MPSRSNADPVERMQHQWRVERPDLDPGAMAVFARLSRAHTAAGEAIEATLAPFGVNRGEFDVLASLRRAGSPFELSAGDLAEAVVLSPSAMTNRLRRLEDRSLVRRRPNPDNGRIVLVSLTGAGRHLVDRAVEAHVATLEGLLDGFSARDRAAVDRLLRRLDPAV